ncbi:hypothetical protein [Paenibacillus polymyxa]|uniref:hypothetical protein n=1 Tax=Paenibacillus polymyxa TaxID=1406 RepID=UPI0032AF3BF8
MEYLEPSNKDIEYVEVKIKIEYRTNHIGYYRMIFNLDGTVEDGFFLSEWTGLRLYQTRALLDDIKEEVEAERINGGITEKEAIKLKEIIDERRT